MRNVIKLIIVVLCIGLCGCSRSLEDVIENEPHFTGVVTKYGDLFGTEAIAVDLNDDVFIEGVDKDWDEIWVPLDVKVDSGVTNFDIGDEVTVYYGGPINDKGTYFLSKTYAIVLETSVQDLE